MVRESGRGQRNASNRPCPGCGGRMMWLEVCRARRDIHRVMRAHGLEPRGPPPVEFSSASWGQLELGFDAGGETRESDPGRPAE